MQCRDPSCTLNVEKMIETRVHTARELRKNLGLPSASTNAYRLVNSEGDRYRSQVLCIYVHVLDIMHSISTIGPPCIDLPSLNSLGKPFPTDPTVHFYVCMSSEGV